MQIPINPEKSQRPHFEDWTTVEEILHNIPQNWKELVNKIGNCYINDYIYTLLPMGGERSSIVQFTHANAPFLEEFLQEKAGANKPIILALTDNADIIGVAEKNNKQLTFICNVRNDDCDIFEDSPEKVLYELLNGKVSVTTIDAEVFDVLPNFKFNIKEDPGINDLDIV